ncbi:MAG: hypothetical protein FWF44_10475 [Defluviitaleaceae bacterium]|nr:hypothetical protein [Defluviitaleaceae bacterium]
MGMKKTTSKKLESLAKMTVELLMDNKVDFVIKIWQSFYTDTPSSGKEEPGKE